MFKSICSNPNHEVIFSLVDFVVRLMQHCVNLFSYNNVEAVDVIERLYFVV